MINVDKELCSHQDYSECSDVRMITIACIDVALDLLNLSVEH